jgi:hypothetical protein
MQPQFAPGTCVAVLRVAVPRRAVLGVAVESVQLRSRGRPINVNSGLRLKKVARQRVLLHCGYSMPRMSYPLGGGICLRCTIRNPEETKC